MNQNALLKAVWPSARDDSERIVRWTVARRVPRTVLNAIYNWLSLRRKGEFYARFAKLFRDGESSVDSGAWGVNFHGRAIRVPLRSDTMWLDWDSALSVLGHEPEIKATYENYIDHFGFPRCVFDVGANYGLHSLLFLVHGVDVVSFEPNPACRDYIQELGRVNDVEFQIEAEALGSREGMLTLRYPERDTWLGTVSPERAREVSSRQPLRCVDVPCESLDAYVQRSGKAPDLVKLDTEGNEQQILLGAVETLKKERPVLVLECWRNDSRRRIWRLLDEVGYSIIQLPLPHPSCAAPMGISEFAEDRSVNFAGLPRELLRR